MNIDELEAGRELDVLVAEKVMGWTNCDIKEDCEQWQSDWHNRVNKTIVKTGMGDPPEPMPGDGIRVLMPPYSVSHGAVWAVIHKLVAEGDCLGQIIDDNGVPSMAMKRTQNIPCGRDPQIPITLTICHAALKAVNAR